MHLVARTCYSENSFALVHRLTSRRARRSGEDARADLATPGTGEVRGDGPHIPIRGDGQSPKLTYGGVGAIV